jgi:hypothetical protein
MTILEQNVLNISSELELFSACYRWAEVHVGTNVTAREALGPALTLIRFRNLTPQQFATVVCPTQLLTVNEERDILCSIASGSDIMPQGFSKSHVQRNLIGLGLPELMKLGVIGKIEEIEFERQICDFNSADQISRHPIQFSVNKNCYILGVMWWSGRAFYNPQSYDEEIQVIILKNETDQIIASTTYTGAVVKLKANKLIFDAPCLLTPDYTYSIHIIYLYPKRDYLCFNLKNQIYHATQSDIQVNFTNNNVLQLTKMFVAKML